MQWLQSPFANRFNRMVRDHGHVFQGRYKALLIEADAQKRRELNQALCRGWYIGTRCTCQPPMGPLYEGRIYP